MFALSKNQAGNVLVVGLVVASLTVGGGCAMCSGTYDCHYAAYGGSRPRGDMIHGRVASAFNDASAPLVEEEVLVDPDSQYPIELAPEEEVVPERLPPVEPIPDTYPTAILDETRFEKGAENDGETAPRQLQPIPNSDLDESSSAPPFSAPTLTRPFRRP